MNELPDYMKSEMGWHFTLGDQLANGDDRKIITNETLSVSGDPILCRHGLHASKSLLDALLYAPGAYLWRVRLSGCIVKGDDKMVATERTPLWGVDATDVLRQFARQCALDVIHLWGAPQIIRDYLMTGDVSQRAAAQTAAQAAAQAAEWAAAQTAWEAARAAWEAAQAAAQAAEWAAAQTAWEAARDAAWAAAQAAEWAAAQTAWEAARDAARQKQSRRLIAMIEKISLQIGAAP